MSLRSSHRLYLQGILTVAGRKRARKKTQKNQRARIPSKKVVAPAVSRLKARHPADTIVLRAAQKQKRFRVLGLGLRGPEAEGLNSRLGLP